MRKGLGCAVWLTLENIILLRLNTLNAEPEPLSSFSVFMSDLQPHTQCLLVRSAGWVVVVVVVICKCVCGCVCGIAGLWDLEPPEAYLHILGHRIGFKLAYHGVWG